MTIDLEKSIWCIGVVAYGYFLIDTTILAPRRWMKMREQIINSCVSEIRKYLERRNLQ